MGYTGTHSLATRCLSEFMATSMFIFLILTLLANKLLPRTKGHDINFGFVSFGIGLAAFLPIQFFGDVSSTMNPAVSLGNAIIGKINWIDFPFLALSQLFAGFVAAVVMYVYYRPHFNTNPVPPKKVENDLLLSKNDPLNTAALSYACYNPRQVFSECKALRVEEILGKDAVAGRNNFTSRSVTVADLHNRLAHIGLTPRERRRSKKIMNELKQSKEIMMKPMREIEQYQNLLLDMKESNTNHTNTNGEPKMREPRRAKIDMSDFTTVVSQINSVVTPISPANISSYSYTEGYSKCPADKPHSVSVDKKPQPISEERDTYYLPLSKPLKILQSSFTDKKDSFDLIEGSTAYETLPNNKGSQSDLSVNTLVKEDTLADATLVADKNMKLVCFCVRPTEYDPLSNVLKEMIACFFLSFGIYMILERAQGLDQGFSDVYVTSVVALLVGLLIMSLVLSLGGVGIALNPVRDLGPRFAHWILPIPGKGSSEWYYCWIPIVGPFLGSTCAAYLFLFLKNTVNLT